MDKNNIGSKGIENSPLPPQTSSPKRPASMGLFKGKATKKVLSEKTNLSSTKNEKTSNETIIPAGNNSVSVPLIPESSWKALMNKEQEVSMSSEQRDYRKGECCFGELITTGAMPASRSEEPKTNTLPAHVFIKKALPGTEKALQHEWKILKDLPRHKNIVGCLGFRTGKSASKLYLEGHLKGSLDNIALAIQKCYIVVHGIYT